MNLQHLRYFVELAKYKNYRIAAEKLYISQPALSKAIKGLEEEIGAPLFLRQDNTNVLTNYGKIFHYYVENCLISLDKGIAQLDVISKERANTIRIAATYTSATQCVPISIVEFSKKYPEVRFQCLQDVSSRVVQSVDDLETDIGLISNFPVPSEMNHIEKILILNYHGIVAISKSHPLATKNSLKLEDLQQIPYIGYSEDCGNFFSLREYFNQNHFESPKDTRYKYNSEVSILAAVEKGLGYAIVSDTHFNRRMDVKFLTIEDSLLEFPLFMIWRSDFLSSSIVNAYKNFVLQAHHLGTIERYNI